MSSGPNRIDAEGEQARPPRRLPARFQEAPGEAQAEAVADALLARAAAHPDRLPMALATADGATREGVITRLHQRRGNACVQRVVAEARGTPGRLVGRSQQEMVEEVLRRKGPGGQIPEAPREAMEGHFGADLEGVRIHTDAEAAALNRELNAAAFTVGSDIFFAEGRFDPSSTAGQAVLAHELAHVGQQTGFSGNCMQRQETPEEDELAVQRQPLEEEEQPPQL